MHAKRQHLVAAAVLEAGTGLALLVVPSAALGLLLGTAKPAPETLLLGRIGGSALLAIGIACWLAHDDAGSPSQRGLLVGLFVYDVAACVLLAYAGAKLRMDGLLLWPAVVVHAALAIWCWHCIRVSPAHSQPDDTHLDPT